MNQRDLIWVRLPFSSLKESKVRPAIIVSNDSYNSKSEDVVVCAITSNLEEKEYSILIDNSSLSSGRLRLSSKIRADKIIQIEKELIIRPFARLNDGAFDRFIEEIKKLIQRK